MKIFSIIGLFIKSLFNNVETFIADHVTPSVETIKRLASAVNSPVVDAITALIPTELDDKAVKWLRKNLNKAVAVTVPVADIINEPDFATKVSKLVAYIKKQPESLQKGILFRLSSEMAASSAGKEKPVKGSSIDLLCQHELCKINAGDSLDKVGKCYCKHCGNPE